MDLIRICVISIITTIQPIFSISLSIKNNNKKRGSETLMYILFLIIISNFIDIIPKDNIKNFGFLLRIIFYEWLQLPYYNGCSIIVNLFFGIIKINTIKIDSEPNLKKLIEQTKKHYLDVLDFLPKPQLDEDSSPSADPSEF